MGIPFQSSLRHISSNAVLENSFIPSTQTPIPSQCHQTISRYHLPRSSTSSHSIATTHQPLSSLTHISTTHIVIIVTLDPRDETQQRQNLRLNLKRNIEITRDVVGPKRHTGTGPEKHHGALEADGVMTTVIDYDLWDELDRPTDCSDGAEDVGCYGNVHIVVLYEYEDCCWRKSLKRKRLAISGRGRRPRVTESGA